jgi:gliding motility-associated-like protein
MKCLKKSQRILFLICALFSNKKGWSQIILEAPNNSLESNYKWFNEADPNFEILATDFYLEVIEPGVYFATYDEIDCKNNATGYFVLTFCDKINSSVTLDLSLAGCDTGEVRWHPSDLGSSLSPTVLATTSAIMYSATWVRETSITKLPEITVMCIPDPNVKDKLIIYNVITPNGDGYNDYLKIEYIESYPENTLEIVNRQGALVYKAKGYDNTSVFFNVFANSGSVLFKNKKLPTDTYFYKLLYKDKNIDKVNAINGYLYIKI